jgi:flavin reductase (DIM6/NTAB) family NADH-FMN oxidoreductase RutF
LLICVPKNKAMQFDPDDLDYTAVYKLLTGSVIPRPIGWISTVDQNGNNNIAPFSYFNAVGEDPPHVMFSTVRGNNTNKDTLNNVLANGQFVVNMVTEELVEQMNLTSQAVAADVDEFEMAGLTPIPSVKVKPMRVKESKVTFECEMVHHYFLENHKQGGACIVIGRIVMMHFDDSVLLDNYKINLETYKPVARLAGSNYSKMGEIFSIKRN